VHLLADLTGVAPAPLCDEARLRGCLLAAAAAAHLHPVAAPCLHRFPGGGLTGFLLLAESHIAFHSYPECGYLAVDIFTCGATDPAAALAVFLDSLAPGGQRITRVGRGSMTVTAGVPAGATAATLAGA
jgi:S-adenosylmethionine decarboxylase